MTVLREGVEKYAGQLSGEQNRGRLPARSTQHGPNLDVRPVALLPLYHWVALNRIPG